MDFFNEKPTVSSLSKLDALTGELSAGARTFLSIINRVVSFNFDSKIYQLPDWKVWKLHTRDFGNLILKTLN